MANIGIVIPTLGTNDCLDDSLRSIARQKVPALSVVVIDQSDGNRISNICHQWQSSLPLVHVRTHRGLSHARNIGIAHLIPGVDIVGLLDDDCVYETNCFQHVVSHFADTSHGAMSGRLWSPEQRIQFGHKHEQLTRSTVWKKSIEPALFFRTSVLQEVGCFDESLGIGCPTPWQSGEGTDLLLRVMKAGYSVHYNPSCEIYEQVSGRVTPINPPVKSRMYGRGTGFVYRRHYSFWSCALIIVRPAIGACLDMVKGDTKSYRKRIQAAIGRWEGATGHLLPWIAPIGR